MKKFISPLVILTAVVPATALAQESGESSGIVSLPDIATNMVNAIGVFSYLVLAVMAIGALVCMYQFGTKLKEAGQENQREQVTPKELVLYFAAAVALSYGSYLIGSGMVTVFGSDISDDNTFTPVSID